MTVSVVTTCFGDYDEFLWDWLCSVQEGHRLPDEIIVVTDRHFDAPGATIIPAHNTWKHAPAFYINEAVKAASSDWVWVMGVDDGAFTDALDGLEDVQEDVWQMGYLTQDGKRYLPPQLTAREYLALSLETPL